MKINKKLIETLTREVIVERQLEKKAVAKKKKDLNESEMLNETPIMDFINAVKDLDPQAIAALGISSLPLVAGVKVIADFIKDKRPTKDKLKDINKTIAATR